MFDMLFVVVNVIPMPYWLLMILLPRHAYTRRLTSGWEVFAVMGVLYTFLLAGSVLLAPSVMGEAPVVIDLSLEGLAALLGTPWGTLIAWTHLLVGDLFMGVWIYQESRRMDAPLIPAGLFLFFTLMSGPFGLLMFLVWRGTRRNSAPAAQ